MGLDIHALNFLKYSIKTKGLGETLTIGRQSLQVKTILKEIKKENPKLSSTIYCEGYLKKYLGSTKVDSVDNSDYEGATYICDMNKQIPSNMVSKFDTVFDGGCLEHIYNIPQALKNCSKLCRSGGQIIHVLPANNFCGHGFWQMSPELFFSLYSSKNGYKNTEVFLADLTDSRRWYKVIKPENGNRVNVLSSNPLYVLVRTFRADENFSHAEVQQSDYEYSWDLSDIKREGKTIKKIKVKKTKIKKIKKSIIKRLRKNYFIYEVFYPYVLRKMTNNKLNKKNPGLIEINVEEVVDNFIYN